MGIEPSENEKSHPDRVPAELPPTPPETVDGENSPSPVDFPLPPPTQEPSEILELDKKTPDNHVPRDPRLIRLTGVHPFNVEAPLSDLYNEGFLTSPELFYVRNHGAVPQVKEEEIPDWEFTVDGLVENPLTLTLKELIADFEQVTCPITLVCAGNRRKEQNQVRKTKGFSWGPAGVSTALFTGVVLSEVLRKARPKRNARYTRYSSSVQIQFAWVQRRDEKTVQFQNDMGKRNRRKEYEYQNRETKDQKTIGSSV
ncbi:molybdopterin binding oxidoreductase [Patellaria atrata CBS 101060]|uniref:Molybdopterin binding oxidoreductase n=1 Tax=Patellaria atrata CBS 101060 TaxID=1346257 RepID=A0A9P4S743_9PEZI|nr:molybdopterin binding oxidoreductase [Patellaria atrata CBS 101060]